MSANMSTMSATVAPTGAKSAVDILKSLGAKPKPADNKKQKPTFAVDEILTQLIDEYLEHAEKAKDEKTFADNYRDEIVSRARPIYHEACRREGKAISSIKIGKVTMEVKNMYTSISYDQSQSLADAFGEDYGRYFRAVTELSIKKTSVEDADVLLHLVQGLGVDFFNEHFDQKTVLKVKEPLHSDIQTRPDIRDKAQPFIDAQIIKPYSPSLKLS